MLPIPSPWRASSPIEPAPQWMMANAANAELTIATVRFIANAFLWRPGSIHGAQTVGDHATTVPTAQAHMPTESQALTKRYPSARPRELTRSGTAAPVRRTIWCCTSYTSVSGRFVLVRAWSAIAESAELPRDSSSSCLSGTLPVANAEASPRVNSVHGSVDSRDGTSFRPPPIGCGRSRDGAQSNLVM